MILLITSIVLFIAGWVIFVIAALLGWILIGCEVLRLFGGKDLERNLISSSFLSQIMWPERLAFQKK